MREALPIVATRVAALPEVVQDGATGILVPPDDPEALAAALLRLVLDPTLCREMGAAGFQRLRERFSAEVMGQRTAELYESVAGLTTDA
jgi:glycosyltransferase involved in cell wall biosynthesis